MSFMSGILSSLVNRWGRALLYFFKDKLVTLIVMVKSYVHLARGQVSAATVPVKTEVPQMVFYRVSYFKHGHVLSSLVNRWG